MKIHLRYLNILRNVVGVGEEMVELTGGSRVLDLLKRLCERHGEQCMGLLFSEGDLNRPNPLLRIVARDTPPFLSPCDYLEDGNSYDLFIATFGG